MKNLIYGLLAMGVVAFAFACQKETNTDNVADLMNQIANSSDKELKAVSQLPNELKDYVAFSFTPLEIEAAWHVRGKGYEVELEDGQNLYFRENGRCIGAGRGGGGGVFRCMRGEVVDVSELPQAALEYIADKYDSPIETVVLKQHGDRTGYAVKLADGTILLFNGAGDFFHVCGEFDGGGHGGHHGDGPHGPHGGCMAGDDVGVDNLPQLAAEYIATSYADQTIASVVVKPTGKFGVELSGGVILLFTPNGVFIKECDGQPTDGPHHHHCNTPITALSELPQAAQDYVATNYADATLVRGCVKNNGNYIIKLSNDVKILFAADGTVIFDSGN